jgi:hypothetical protein
MKKLLVHTCCAPCATYSFEKLFQDGFFPVSFFYNPNIHPENEYKRRLDELIKFTDVKKYPLIIQEDLTEIWFKAVQGFEEEKEGGSRCEICFRLRLEKTAIYAKENSFVGFTTVLTISPHKNSAIINQIGKELSKKHDVPFLEENFKKNEGFKKSLEFSKEYNLYRQSYCGCVFSQK